MKTTFGLRMGKPAFGALVFAGVFWGLSFIYYTPEQVETLLQFIGLPSIKPMTLTVFQGIAIFLTMISMTYAAVDQRQEISEPKEELKKEKNKAG